MEDTPSELIAAMYELESAAARLFKLVDDWPRRPGEFFPFDGDVGEAEREEWAALKASGSDLPAAIDAAGPGAALPVHADWASAPSLGWKCLSGAVRVVAKPAYHGAEDVLLSADEVVISRDRARIRPRRPTSAAPTLTSAMRSGELHGAGGPSEIASSGPAPAESGQVVEQPAGGAADEWWDPAERLEEPSAWSDQDQRFFLERFGG